MNNQAKSSKSSYKEERKRQLEKQQKQTKRLVWITVVCVIAIIAVAFILKPKTPAYSFAYDKLPVLGKTDAPIKIVEVGDFKCPTCQYFSQTVEPKLKADFIDTGKAALYFMNYTFIGPDSYTAALAGQSIYHQNNDAFWKYYDAVYKNQQDEKIQWATPQFLTDLARKEGIPVDYDKLKQEIESAKYASEVDEHNAFAKKNVTGTPTIFINGKKLEKFDYESIKLAIEEAQKGGSSS
jgi:protein-disulfide isomerase